MSRFVLLLFPALASTLLSTGCTSMPGASPPGSVETSSTSSAPKQDQAATSNEHLENRVPVAAGPFTFGASENLFRYYMVQSRFRYPTLEKDLRKRLITPDREEILPSYFIDPFEVTNRQFLDFLKATGYRPDNGVNFLKHWESPDRYPEWAEAFPVVWVSQKDAEAYCRAQGGDLPSEEEWEKAARGTDGRLFPWGKKKIVRETAVFGVEQPEPTGNRPDDVSPYQVYDMGGNVSEWTSTRTGKAGLPQGVVRGGAFNEAGREMLTYNRRLHPIDYRAETVGFRCAFHK